MKKMSEREINLLIFLGVFVVLVAFWQFVLMPIMAARNTMNVEIGMLEAQKEDYDLLMAEYDENKAYLEQLRRDKAAAAKDIYPYMQSQEVDRLITNIVLRLGLDAKDLTMQHATEPTVVEPYVLSFVSPSETPQLYVSDVQLRMLGSETLVWQLIDLFTNDSPSIRVKSFALSKNTLTTSEEQESFPDRIELKLNIAVYMYGE